MSTSQALNEQTRPSASPWIVFAICGVAIYLTTLDLSIVNVAFPEILREFDISRADASWIVTLYNIFYGSLLVVAGKTADQLGRRRMFVGGVGVFAIGSVVATVAPGLATLLVGRSLQGIGGAMLTPASLGLLIGAFPAEKRTQVVAMWGGIGALGVASGPSLGAFAISIFDWRAAFWLNLPICAWLVAAAFRRLEETPRVPSKHRPDYLGASLVTASLALTVLAISQSEAWGFADLRTLLAAGVGVAIVPLFLSRQRSHPEPVLDLTLFTSRSFTVANISGLAFFGGFAATGLNNVLFLRQVWEYSVLKAGLLSAIAPASVALLAPFTGRAAARYGFRPFVVAGPLIVGATLLTFPSILDAEPRPWLFVGLGQLVAIGIALFIPVNSAAAVADLPPDRLSVGGAVSNTFRQIGSALGIACLVAVLGAPESAAELLDAHHAGWYLVAAFVLASGLIGSVQTSRRGPNPIQRST